MATNVFLPLRRDVFEAKPPKIFGVDVPDASGDMEAVEILESEGEDLFAMESGQLIADKEGQLLLQVGAPTDEISHTWVMQNAVGTKAQPSRDVTAGQKIGKVKGGNLILSVIDDDSPEVDLGADKGGVIKLQHSPLDLMDQLDVMYLPGDIDPSEIDTDEERHNVSEGITGRGKKKKSPIVKIVATVASIFGGLWLFKKIAE